MPFDVVLNGVARLAQTYVSLLEPRDGLRFLFGLEARLYPYTGMLASAYGNGVHPKHRLMRYHDFFVQRIQSGERVLDVGCGAGEVAYDIAERAEAFVVAIDVNAGKIAEARQRFAHPRVEFRVGDILQETPDGGYDVVVLSNVLEHLPGRSKLLRRLQLAVHPSRFLIRVPLYERDWRVPLKRELGVEWRLDVTHEIEYTPESFAAEMSEAGMEISHQEVRWGEIWAEAGVARET